MPEPRGGQTLRFASGGRAARHSGAFARAGSYAQRLMDPRCPSSPLLRPTALAASRGARRRTLWLVPVLIALIAACSASPASQFQPSPRDDRSTDCPRLQSSLRTIVSAPDPESAATEAGLTVADGRITVLLALREADAGVLERFGLVSEGRSGEQFVAAVPLHQLCLLAQDPSVTAITLPARPVLP